MLNLSTRMVCDLPWCSLVRRKVKREQTLCIRLNRVIVGKLESNITEAEVRVRRLRLFRSSVSVPPLGTLYITAKRPKHVTRD